jgi:FeS assembly SUF system protein
MKQLPVIQNPTSTAVSAESGSQTAGMAADLESTAALKPQIVAALSEVFDPEIPVNIYELGLIYDIVVDAAGVVGIRMTLTAPACPAAQVLPADVARKIRQIPGVADVKVDVVWDPPWTRDRMSETARLQLGMF